MKDLSQAYRAVGLMLIPSGIILFTLAFFMLNSTPLSALGISMIILGSVILALSTGIPRMSAEAARLMVESSIRNTSALIEELGLRSRAVYLPSRLTDGKPMALIPLTSNPGHPKIDKPLPKRLIVRYGLKEEDVGVLMETPGSIVAGMLEKPSEPSESTAGTLESSLSTALVNVLGLVDSMKASINGEDIIVELSNPKITINGKTLASEVLGSPLASTVASLAAEALDKPVIVESEEPSKNRILLRLRVLE
ncbi:MAG: hypothetical protein QXL27_08625 [Candidatus Bathyarchaeia archaeon]